MEETNYVRASVLANETQNVIDGIPTGHVDDENVSRTLASGEKSLSQKANDDSHTIDSRDVNVTEQPSNALTLPAPDYRPKTYLQKLKVFDKARPITHFWSMVLRPLRLMRYPVVLYCAFSYGGSLIWYSVLNATASLILSAPPYNFSPYVIKTPLEKIHETNMTQGIRRSSVHRMHHRSAHWESSRRCVWRLGCDQDRTSQERHLGIRVQAVAEPDPRLDPSILAPTLGCWSCTSHLLVWPGLRHGSDRRCGCAFSPSLSVVLHRHLQGLRS